MEEINRYLEEVDSKRKNEFRHLYDVIKENIPDGFEESFNYGMISFVVPLSLYPTGYLNRKDEPIPFISLAAQKQHIAVYHMGIIGNETLLKWFEEEYKNNMSTKLNMGKSCIRFTNVKTIPYELMSELVGKMSMDDWLKQYDMFVTNKNK